MKTLVCTGCGKRLFPPDWHGYYGDDVYCIDCIPDRGEDPEPEVES